MKKQMKQNSFDRLRLAGRTILPRNMIRLLKKLYYPHVLKRFEESRWPLATVAKQLVQSGDTVVDAGANIGYVTLLFSRWVGAEGRVLSFEPVPETCDLLRHNIRMVGLANVVVHDCGLSDREGDAVMEIPLYNEGGGENLYESRIISPGEGQATLRQVAIRTKALDAIFEGACFSHPSFVKIDVEGHEASVLGGMQRLLKEAKPALLIELSGPPIARANLFKSLQGLGYAAYAWTGAALQLRPEPADDVDCFFLQPQHEQLLGL